MTSTATQDLRDHLESMFQFENGDLDFGIYKVLRLKRAEVQAFLDTELGEIVTTELSKAVQGAQDAQFERLARYIQDEKGQRYQALVFSPQTVSENREELRKAVAGADDEAELLSAIDGSSGVDPEIEDRVYNHLLAFFGRYYRNGDFGYNDRSLATYKVDYPVPPAEADYDGSDVLLHWKHKDSYYIKTANGFPTVRFDHDGTTVEYRLETGGEDEQAKTRNNNKDDGRKHYTLDRIDTTEDGVVGVVFRLAERSTSKADVFAQVMNAAFGVSGGLDEYLYRPAGKGETQGKPAFNDLEGDYDKVENGGLKGQGQLRLGLDSYLRAIVGHKSFERLGSNNEKRMAALENDETVRRLHTLDQRLNRFYVGVDADYFVHKDLGGFLRREAGRYVKDVILSGVEGLLAEERDEVAFLVARAFYRVADRIIAFLAATEEFQKNLFLLKKKVVQTDWLVSVGKLGAWITDNEARSVVLSEIASNEAQKAEWSATFGVEVVDPNQLLLTHPTLPIDTRHFDGAFTRRLLAACPDIERETTGLLLNSENLQALRLLSESYRGKVKCVYIDPPYNTGGDDFLYKDSFRHSSWLSMMYDRIETGSKLLTSDGAFFASIDDREHPTLRRVMDQLLGEGRFAASFIWQKVDSPNDNKVPITSDHEYVLSFSMCDYTAAFSRMPDESIIDAYGQTDEDGRKYRDRLLKKNGRNSMREDRPTMYFPVIDPDGGEVYPLHDSGRPACWAAGRSSVEKHKSNGTLVWKRREVAGTERWEPYTREFAPECPERPYPTIWTDVKTMRQAKAQLKSMGMGDAFSTPKPTQLLERIVLMSTSKTSTVLDYFAGSGTTGQAVLGLNKQDEGQRRFVLVEMGDYFERVLLERIRRVMYSLDWKDGTPKGAANGTVGLVKVQALEGYEDVLDALRQDDAPAGIEMSYLYRPQEQSVRSTLDLTRPFANTVRVGKGGDTRTVDVLETYAYLQGFAVERLGTHETDGREIRWFRSGRHLVAFRDVTPGQDDAGDLLALVASHEGVEVLHVNEYVDERRFDQSAVSLRTVTASDFDRGASWS